MFLRRARVSEQKTRNESQNPRENPVPRSLFALKQNGIACYAGFSPDTNGQTLYKEIIKYFMQTKIGKKKKLRDAKVLMNKAWKKNILITMWKRNVTKRNFVSAPDRCKPWAWFSQSRFYVLFEVNLHLFNTFFVQKSIMLVEAFNWRSVFKKTMSLSF